MSDVFHDRTDNNNDVMSDDDVSNNEDKETDDDVFFLGGPGNNEPVKQKNKDSCHGGMPIPQLLWRVE